MISRPMSLEDDPGIICRVKDKWAFGFGESCVFLGERAPDDRGDVWLECLMPDLKVRCYRRVHLEVLIPCKI